MKCDELKAYNGDIYIPVYGSVADAKVYLKSEADKVIADLEESHKKEVEQLLMEIVELKKVCNDKDNWCLCTLEENRHHKYKRCLDKAETCKSRQIYLHSLTRIYSDKELWEYASDYWIKWSKNWLELAKKIQGGDEWLKHGLQVYSHFSPERLSGCTSGKEDGTRTSKKKIAKNGQNNAKSELERGQTLSSLTRGQESTSSRSNTCVRTASKNYSTNSPTGISYTTRSGTGK